MFQESSSDEEELGGKTSAAPAPAPAPESKTSKPADDSDDSDDEPVGGVKAEAEENKNKSKSKSKNSAFDEDSDDDDDAEFDGGKKDEKTTSKEKKSESALGDTDDEDGDGGDKSKEKKEKKEEKNKSLMDSDSDEGDEEFDDGGAIVGSSAPAVESAPKLGSSAADAQPGASSSAAPRKSARPPQKATVLEVERPKSGVSFHMTKLPNLVGIQSTAFDEETYNGAEEEQQYQGYVHNMVRWRYKQDSSGNMSRDSDGNLIRESNAKLVKWSDGSFTMHIGSEAFDIQAVDSSSNGFAGLNGYIYLSQKSTFRNEGEEEDTPGGTVLECIGPVTSRLITKPSSLQSEAHKSLTLAVRQKAVKTSRIAEYVTQEDPEKLKRERIRVNQDEGKIQSKKRSNYRSNYSRRAPGLNSKYLEEDDDNYDSINIRALKRGNAMDDDMDDYGEESDGDDEAYEDTFGSRTRKRQKKAREEDEEEELVFDNESDEEVTLIKAHKKKRPHQAVVEDDDDDDDDDDE